MKKRSFNPILLILYLSILPASQGWAQVEATSDRPNIIFIFADDWGWGDLSLRKHPSFETPHLDQMAAEGADFLQFTVSHAVCSPSRTAVMTGHYPARHSVHRHFASLKANADRGMPDWLNPSAVQLPRLLQEAGYATGHFGKWHLSNVSAKDAPLPEAYGYDVAAVFNGPGVQANPSNSDVDDKAIAFIQENRNRPFFINLWLHETHTAHFPKERYLERFEHLGEFEQVYAAILAEGDARVGRILQALEDEGLSEDTLVIFSSDNGPERQRVDRRLMKDYSFSDEVLDGYATAYSVGSTGGLKGRKRSLYEGGIRVPFIVRWPEKVPAGMLDVTSVITAVDLLPTFCEIAGVALPDGYQADGESFYPALRGEDWQRSKPIFWECKGGSPTGTNWPRLALRLGGWKLLMDFEGDRQELYHIPSDPEESNDLAASQPGRVKAMAQEIFEWRATLPETAPTEGISRFRQ